MNKHNSSVIDSKKDTFVFTSPQWVTCFFAIAVPASLVPFFIGFILGFSVASDVVFGLYALLSGIFADYIIRIRFKRSLMFFIKPRVPFILVWILLCFYVMLFSPLH